MDLCDRDPFKSSEFVMCRHDVSNVHVVDLLHLLLPDV